MNVILENTDNVRYFTNMSLTLEACGLSASSFDWYVSDIETNYYGNEFYPVDQWMSGDELDRFLGHNDVQFIWAVFSAVPKGYRSTMTGSPYVEGNPEYWNGKEINPQLPEALFEIACWDSSATIFVGLPTEALQNLRRNYPEVKSLAARK